MREILYPLCTTVGVFRCVFDSIISIKSYRINTRISSFRAIPNKLPYINSLSGSKNSVPCVCYLRLIFSSSKQNHTEYCIILEIKIHLPLLAEPPLFSWNCINSCWFDWNFSGHKFNKNENIYVSKYNALITHMWTTRGIRFERTTNWQMSIDLTAQCVCVYIYIIVPWIYTTAKWNVRQSVDTQKFSTRHLLCKAQLMEQPWIFFMSESEHKKWI